MNPYIVLAAVLASLGLASATGWKCYHLGEEHQIAAQTKQDELIRAVSQASQEAAAAAIAKNKPVFTTIHQAVQKEIIHDQTYINCRHPDVVRRLLDNALTQTVTVTEPAGDSELPHADAPSG